MAGWFSRQGGKLFGYGKKLVGTREIETNHQILKDSWQNISQWRQKPVVEETFANAYARFNLTEKQLKAVYTQFVFRFYLFLGLLLIDVFSVAYFIVQGNWMGILPCIGFFAICGVQLFVASFRTYQIQKRELVAVSDWWRDPDGWWPSKFKERSKSKSSKSSSLQKSSRS